MKPVKIAGKLATQEMIEGVGGYDPAQMFCRLKKSALQEATSLNPKHSTRFMPIDVVADLEPLAREREGWPHVTRWLCSVMGGFFVPRPQASGGRADWLGSVGQLAREHGDIATAICRALADDNDIDPAEATAVRAEVQSALSVLLALDLQLATIAGER